jgi:hypothetical protein
MTLGFPSGAARRLSAAAALVAALWLLVWLVERPRPSAAVLAPEGTARALRIDLTASRPVRAWRVAIDGVPVAGEPAATAWTGAVTASRRRCALAVRAEVDGEAPAALRVRVEGEGAWIDATTWAAGTVDTAVALASCP